ncbi:class I tRNA ligase family protein [endosymbiont of Metamasius hemipterus]|uniref:Class I tRNA ligase family protein n=1 Tax=endosymbiont of Metamasius hemipterus TaxID=204627 RepID=A0ABT0TWI4_9GAMM|nr:class I tRNA ligase family protein [endosymbiont of Metamasius hemipterus]
MNFNEFWINNSNTKIYQFIGKDIIYFHGLFWLSILKVSKFKLPNKFIVHGHLLINGKKMSKSCNNFITANDLYKKIETDYLRFFFAYKLSSKINDINLDFNEFCIIINNLLIDRIINIPNRINNFIYTFFNNTTSNIIDNNNLYNYFINKNIKI